jgi:hypothetical protein
MTSEKHCPLIPYHKPSIHKGIKNGKLQNYYKPNKHTYQAIHYLIIYIICITAPTYLSSYKNIM